MPFCICQSWHAGNPRELTTDMKARASLSSGCCGPRSTPQLENAHSQLAPTLRAGQRTLIKGKAVKGINHVHSAPFRHHLKLLPSLYILCATSQYIKTAACTKRMRHAASNACCTQHGVSIEVIILQRLQDFRSGWRPAQACRETRRTPGSAPSSL